MAALAMVSVVAMSQAATVDNIGPGGKSARTDAVNRLVMAQRLIAYGDANKDAMSLIVAVKILKANPTRSLEATKAIEGKAESKVGKSRAEVDYSVASVLGRAKQYAAGRKDLIALADDVDATASKGTNKMAGPTFKRDQVLPGHTDIWSIRFIGGEPAIVAIQGDGSTDLDFYVYDEYGNLGPSDTDSTDYTQLSWTPRYSGIFRVKIVNHGDVSNHYELMTN